ncbi:MAG: hypothetical protein ACKPKO_37660, partial [Candidatus Fonsibacter sp.]
RVVWDGKTNITLEYGTEKYAKKAYKAFAQQFNVNIEDAINKEKEELKKQHQAILKQLQSLDTSDSDDDSDQSDRVDVAAQKQVVLIQDEVVVDEEDVVKKKETKQNEKAKQTTPSAKQKELKTSTYMGMNGRHY